MNQTVAPPPPAPPLQAPPSPAPRRESHFAYLILLRLASLRITVVLFVMSLLLVFWGTLAQTDAGVWTVVAKYFRSFFVLVPIRVILFNAVENKELVIPYPGGLLLGSIMLVNLLAAHAVRFKLAWNRSGIILIHVGIIVMMLSEVVTYLWADEGQMMIALGQTVKHVIHTRQSELAVIWQKDDRTDEVVVVPDRLLTRGAKIHDERLPFDIEVIDYMVNTKWIDPEKRPPTPVNKGVGVREVLMGVPEVSGVDPNQTTDSPAAVVRLSHNGQALGVWLFSVWFSETHAHMVQEVTVGDKTYEVVLRYKQTADRPFRLHLTHFKQEFYPGTTKPKDYRSFVRLIDESEGVDRDVEIYMNAPLRYRGETFYQASVTTDRPGGNPVGTVLQVVRNPGWLLPYISCAIVGIGMLIHFGLTLQKFIDHRRVR